MAHIKKVPYKKVIQTIAKDHNLPYDTVELVVLSLVNEIVDILGADLSFNIPNFGTFFNKNLKGGLKNIAGKQTITLGNRHNPTFQPSITFVNIIRRFFEEKEARDSRYGTANRRKNSETEKKET